MSDPYACGWNAAQLGKVSSSDNGNRLGLEAAFIETRFGPLCNGEFLATPHAAASEVVPPFLDYSCASYNSNVGPPEDRLLQSTVACDTLVKSSTSKTSTKCNNTFLNTECCEEWCTETEDCGGFTVVGINIDNVSVCFFINKTTTPTDCGRSNNGTFPFPVVGNGTLLSSSCHRKIATAAPTTTTIDNDDDDDALVIVLSVCLPLVTIVSVFLLLWCYCKKREAGGSSSNSYGGGKPARVSRVLGSV